ncbi:MAG: hypothetical protein ACNI3C_11140 [Candidatus Marinarcus sp.]|uniref:hypothetical protein n=1 Tax=Candidatus Marinarcus sp. TaxID=3100987 RepID=UPI003AFF94DF
MREKFQKPAFLIFTFILFFALLNMFIIPITYYNTLENSFILIFAFWAVMICVLFLMSYFNIYKKEDFDV